MVFYHNIADNYLNLDNAISNHSGDEIVTYKSFDGKKLNLAFYYPENYDKNNKYPVFVFVHGGGWAGRAVFADQNDWAGDHLGFLARYYANKGYVSVSIDYRLMQNEGQQAGYELIDLYDDCCDAVKFLIQNADNYGLDFENSVLLGESAGGYLAGALATMFCKEKPVFKKAILVNAILNMLDSHWRQRIAKNSEHPALKGKSAEYAAEFMSPVLNITENTPEILLVHGTSDYVVRPYHSYYFHDEMYLHKKTAEQHMINGGEHAFLLAEYLLGKNEPIAVTKTAIEIIDKWLNV